MRAYLTYVFKNIIRLLNSSSTIKYIIYLHPNFISTSIVGFSSNKIILPHKKKISQNFSLHYSTNEKLQEFLNL